MLSFTCALFSLALALSTNAQSTPPPIAIGGMSILTIQPSTVDVLSVTPNSPYLSYFTGKNYSHNMYNVNGYGDFTIQYKFPGSVTYNISLNLNNSGMLTTTASTTPYKFDSGCTPNDNSGITHCQLTLTPPPGPPATISHCIQVNLTSGGSAHVGYDASNSLCYLYPDGENRLIGFNGLLDDGGVWNLSSQTVEVGQQYRAYDFPMQ